MSLKRGVLLLCIVCHTLAGSPVWGGNVPPSSVFVFHVKWGESDQTGLALANPTDRVAVVTLFLFNNNGTLADPLAREVVIQPNEQRADVLTDVFPDVVQVDGFILAFSDNAGEVREILQSIFKTATLEEWRERLAAMKGQWGPFQTVGQLASDPQVVANGHIIDIDAGDGSHFQVVSNPVQFDETPPELRKGPEHGQHTEEFLLEFGLEWERIAELKASGAIN